MPQHTTDCVPVVLWDPMAKAPVKLLSFEAIGTVHAASKILGKLGPRSRLGRALFPCTYSTMAVQYLDDRSMGCCGSFDFKPIHPDLDASRILAHAFKVHKHHPIPNKVSPNSLHPKRYKAQMYPDAHE